MSHCENEQLELDLQPEDLFHRFADRITQLVYQHGISEAVCSELRNWGQFHELPTVASWTRRLLRRGMMHYGSAAMLLECFGISFRGDIVGHIGRDLITAPLSSENEPFRAAAVNVLARWLEYDEDGMWHEMAVAHIERETNTELADHLIAHLDFEEDEDLDEEVQEVDPLLEEFLEVRRGCEIEMRGTAPILRIKPIICQLTGLTPPVLGSIIEYIQFPLENINGEPIDISRVMDELQYSQPATQHLGVLWSQVGDGRHLRIWDTNGSFALSVEPTASCRDEDPSNHRWLFFCYVR